MKKYLLRLFGILGIVIFLPLFILTLTSPHNIEKSAKEFIHWKLNNEVNKKIDVLQWHKSQTLEKFLGNKASKLNKKVNEELDRYKLLLKNDVPKILATQLAKVRNLNCKCREKWEERLTSFVKFEIVTLEKTKEKLADFMQAKYMEIVTKLIFDIRIFSGINLLVFLFLFIVSFLKPKATDHLFLPAALLLLSTIISSYFYLFKQNWFYTIIYNDYTGFTYLVYLLLIFAFLCDIVFNKAKITTRIINTIGNFIGSFSVSAC